jgi:hypothetical protein
MLINNICYMFLFQYVVVFDKHKWMYFIYITKKNEHMRVYII